MCQRPTKDDSWRDPFLFITLRRSIFNLFVKLFLKERCGFDLSENNENLHFENMLSLGVACYLKKVILGTQDCARR